MVKEFKSSWFGTFVSATGVGSGSCEVLEDAFQFYRAIQRGGDAAYKLADGFANLAPTLRWIAPGTGQQEPMLNDGPNQTRPDTDHLPNRC